MTRQIFASLFLMGCLLPGCIDEMAAEMERRGLVKVTGGPFLMGCDESPTLSCPNGELPRHQDQVDTFWIEKTEVTVAAYHKCVEAGQCNAAGLSQYGDCNWGKEGREQHPLNCVTWQQAHQYCDAVGLRLPNEREWEKAAGGEQGFRYAWGNEWEEGRANTLESQHKGTVAVGSSPADVSPYGVLDMTGNVWEWVQDWYDVDYLRRRVDPNRKGKVRQDRKSARGGSWAFYYRLARIAGRHSVQPDKAQPYIGFRCAGPPHVKEPDTQP